MRRPALLCLLWAFPNSSLAAPILSEFLAANDGSIEDADGDHSDWIEIANPDLAVMDLAGWTLTDDAAKPEKWALPAGVKAPPGGRLLVFASGKDRRDPAKELHANFTLKAEGEYLGLFPPGGGKAASEFAPKYPPQREDVSYGVGERALAKPLVEEAGPARLLVGMEAPANWAAPDFDDSAWTASTAAIGYDDMTGELAGELLAYWNFDDAADPKRALDSSPSGHHGTVSGSAAFTSPGGGRSGGANDRAMDFSNGTSAGLRIAAAARGGFQAITKNDAMTISLWAFGGAKLPSNHAAFWFNGDANTRTASVHLPWSDKTIYFDTAGCCNGDTRISLNEPDASQWQGRWNHYVFLKNRERKEIWRNGALWHSGDGAAPMTAIRDVWFGSGVGGASPYPGKMDDIAVWASALSADDIGQLAAGASPLTVGGYLPKIRTDARARMQGVSPSAFLRAAFDLPDGPLPDRLVLRARYDDGLVVYLNGVEAARRQPAARSKDAVLAGEEIDLSGLATHLRRGRNTLAVHGMNVSADDGDFLLTLELKGAHSLSGRYFPEPSPGSANGLGVAGFVEPPKFSRSRGFYDVAMPLTISSATPGASLVFTVDGSAPSETNGDRLQPAGPQVLASATINLATTRVVRARAFKPDHAPSPIETHTFLFADHVARQPSSLPGYPDTWGVYGAYGPRQGQPLPADYEMDPDVVNATAAGYDIREALLSLPALCLTTSVADMFDAKTGLYPNSVSQGSKWVRPSSAELIYPDGSPGWQKDAGLRIHGGLSRQHWHARKHSFRLHLRREFGPPTLQDRLFADTRVTKFNELTLRASSTDGWSVEDSQPWTRRKATYMRDVWMKDTQQAMGHPCGHSRYVHVFLNGLYWGQYNLAERPEKLWQAENFGGDPEEYDIIKDVGEVEAGTKAIWSEMMSLARSGLTSDAAYYRLQGRDASGGRDPSLPVYLHLDSLIDYMILHIYSGAIDWPNHNWWAARRRGPASEGFRFFTWDQEITNISLTQTTTYTSETFANVATVDSPAFLYSKLRANALFRERFTRRAVELTTGHGILTPAQNGARWERRQAEIDKSIVAESARWGDSRQASPLTRQIWLAEMNWMKNTYWPQIHATAIKRFRGVNLYPAETPPAPAPVEFAPFTAMAISEIHYHPENEAEEFLELTNTSATQPVLLSGARISGAVDFVFPNALTIPAGGRLIVVRDRAAFEARHGRGLPIVGEFSGQLSNDGEWLRLLDPAGAVRLRFRYDDDAPWPTAADGQGRSLVLTGADPASAASWRASATIGGSPGVDESNDPRADRDGDGLSALLERFLGTSDGDPLDGPAALPRLVIQGQLVRLTLTRSLGAGDLAFAWEVSTDLKDWSRATLSPATSQILDGKEVLSHTLDRSRLGYLRLRVWVP